MSDARRKILDLVHRPPPAGDWERPDAPLPEIGRDLATHFAARARRHSSDVTGPVPASAAGRAVSDYLHERSLPETAVCWPALAGLDWRSAGLTVEPRAARPADLVGITTAFCAVAETGSLMLLSGPDTPTSVSLLPETHVVLLPVSRIVGRMEDAWALLRRGSRGLSRAINFVSGPSRTADIEQTVTLGAHGPYRVLIVLTSE
jgi:L-lactate dehydrogenase complex protein LldG